MLGSKPWRKKAHYCVQARAGVQRGEREVVQPFTGAGEQDLAELRREVRAVWQDAASDRPGRQGL